MGLGGEIHQPQPVIDPLLDEIPCQPLILKAEGDVLGHRQVGEEGVGLKHDAKVALLGRQAGDVAPPCQISPLSGRSSPAMALSKVVLPQPEGPRKQINSPAPMVREIPEGLKRTELLVEMLNVQIGLGHGSTRY